MFVFHVGKWPRHATPFYPHLPTPNVGWIFDYVERNYCSDSDVSVFHTRLIIGPSSIQIFFLTVSSYFILKIRTCLTHDSQKKKNRGGKEKNVNENVPINMILWLTPGLRSTTSKNQVMNDWQRFLIVEVIWVIMYTVYSIAKMLHKSISIHLSKKILFSHTKII